MVLPLGQGREQYQEKSAIGLDGLGAAVPPMFIWRCMGVQLPFPACADPFLHAFPAFRARKGGFTPGFCICKMPF